MAKTLWGNVYYKDLFAGRLEEKPGGRFVFTYDQSYLDARSPAIAYTLPLSPEPFICEYGLHPFFDNLVSEGWLCKAQARALGVNPNNRFALLLGFGFDLAGAVSIVDPDPAKHHHLDHADDATLAALSSRASLSGVQRKLLVVKEGKGFRPVRSNELSTHIAKLPSGNLSGLLDLEYLTTAVTQQLLPDDQTVEMILTELALNESKETALIIPRFDRSPTGKRLHHFEEFNQLLGNNSGDDKYEGSYEDMGKFILKNNNGVSVESYRLFKRIIVCLLTGNTDAHFKNFAMFHTSSGLQLTPAYDLVASSVYPEYQSIALYVGNIRNLQIGKLEAKHIVNMSKHFGINNDVLIDIVEDIGKRIPNALSFLEDSDVASILLKEKLQDKLEKRWNGSFKLIGNYLSKRQGNGAKNKS